MSKLKVQVIGGNPTSPKRALELIYRHRAVYVDERTIQLLPAVIAEAEEPRSPSVPRQSPTPPKIDEFRGDAFMGQTFLHYPQPDSFRGNPFEEMCEMPFPFEEAA